MDKDNKPKTDKIKKETLRMSHLYKQVFGSPDGMEVLKDLMVASGLMLTSNSLKVEDLAFKEGQRDLVLRIIQSIQLDPMKYMKLIESIRDQQEEIYS